MMRPKRGSRSKSMPFLFAAVAVMTWLGALAVEGEQQIQVRRDAEAMHILSQLELGKAQRPRYYVE